MVEYNLVNDDCLEILPETPDNSIDMVLADLPYGTTACGWDSIIPLDELWEQYKRIGKDNTPYVFTASQPFTTKLIQSNMDWFKYEWVWDKHIPRNFINADKMPMQKHENILVFGDGKVNYNPQMEKRDEPVTVKNYSKESDDSSYQLNKDGSDKKERTYTHRNPDTIIEGCWQSNNKKSHPTEKPVSLFEYLIKTYTNEGDLVLDNVMGSGTTGVACQKTDRRFLGIEQDEEYFEIAQERIKEAKNTDWERVEGIEEWQEFNGIGEKTATTLYDELGSVREANMEQLESIDGIGSKTADKIRGEETNDSN